MTRYERELRTCVYAYRATRKTRNNTRHDAVIAVRFIIVIIITRLLILHTNTFCNSWKRYSMIHEIQHICIQWINYIRMKRNCLYVSKRINAKELFVFKHCLYLLLWMCAVFLVYRGRPGRFPRCYRSTKPPSVVRVSWSLSTCHPRHRTSLTSRTGSILRSWLSIFQMSIVRLVLVPI